MKLFFTSFIILSSLFIISCSCKCGIEKNSDIPENVITKANQYITSKTGNEFFDKYISLDQSKSQEISPNYFLVYDFNIPGKEYVNEEISFTVDQNGTPIKDQEIAGIPDCFSSPSSCNYNIDEDDAINIAKQNGLEEGIKDWQTEFLWNSNQKKYVWHILSTIWESEGEYSRGRGKEMIIDPSDGEVLETNNWHVR